MDAAIRDMLHEAVLIAPWVSNDPYGKPVYGPAVASPAYIERHFQTLLSTVGAQWVEGTVLCLPTDAGMGERSQLPLPDGKIVPIEGLKPIKDENGALDHVQVYL